jgi:hypothetical protein
MYGKYSLTYQNQVEQQNELPSGIRIGSFQPDLIPAYLAMSNLCFITNEQTRQAAIRQMQYIALSLLKEVSPDLLQLTFVDFGMNTNFPLIHSLNLPNIKFVKNQQELEDEFDRLYQTAQNLSSECFTNGIDYLSDYNKVNDNKEPYHILFIANFPHKSDFREEDIDTVSAFINEGRKSGIYLIMNYDEAFFPKKTKYGKEQLVNLSFIPKQMVCLDCTKERVELINYGGQIQKMFAYYTFIFENYPQNELSALIDHINQANAEQDDLTENFLSVPIGKSGKKEICFEMGQRALANHGFIAGGNDTGKSTFLHNIITTIADKYSPDELRLCLMDFKGVDFNRYKDHPNVMFLLTGGEGSNVSVGLMALKSLDKEMTERQRKFNEAGETIDKIAAYNQVAQTKMPRILIIIDEAQTLFIDYSVSKQVNKLFSTIVRKGRSFGLHVLLSSQTFKDVDIADDVKNEMSLRIAFKLNSKNCGEIMEYGNDAPADLEKFEIIYNGENGRENANVRVKLYPIDKDKLFSLYENVKNKHKGYTPFQKLEFSEEDIESSKNEEEKNGVFDGCNIIDSVINNSYKYGNKGDNF